MIYAYIFRYLYKDDIAYAVAWNFNDRSEFDASMARKQNYYYVKEVPYSCFKNLSTNYRLGHYIKLPSHIKISK